MEFSYVFSCYLYYFILKKYLNISFICNLP